MAKSRYAADVDVYVEGINELLRALHRADPEASKKLKDASNVIATDVMAPSYQRSAAAVPHWGPDLAAGIRAKRDRIPSVSIGYTRASMKGGASSALIRNATDTGIGRESFAPFEYTGWIGRAKSYKPRALELWGDAIEKVVADFNNDGIF